MNIEIELYNDDDDYGKLKMRLNGNDEETINQIIQEASLDTWNDTWTIRHVLEKLFTNHAEFYEAIGFDSSTEHGGTGQSFNTRGFRQFCEEYFDADSIKYIDNPQHKQEICNAITPKIRDIVEEFEDTDRDTVATNTIQPVKGGERTLPEPDMVDDALLVTNDGVKKINVQEAENVDTLQEVQDQVRNDTKDVYENRLNAQVKALKNRIDQKEQELEQAKQDMFVEGLRFLDNKDNWEIRNGYLVYTDRIYIEEVTKRYTDENKRYIIKDEYSDKFWVDGVKVKINDKIKKVKYDEAYHPHALNRGVCTGTFSNEPLREGLDKVVQQMKQANLHAGAMNESETDLKQNLDEYTREPGEDDDTNNEYWEV